MSLWQDSSHTKFWEPEEAVGGLWDSPGREARRRPAFAEAAIELAAVKGALGVLFRGLGGEPGRRDQGRQATRLPVTAAHGAAALARDAERIETARFDGVDLVPAGKNRRISPTPISTANFISGWPPSPSRPGRANRRQADPLRRDVVAPAPRPCSIASAPSALFPGLAPIRDALAAADAVPSRPPFDGAGRSKRKWRPGFARASRGAARNRHAA